MKESPYTPVPDMKAQADLHGRTGVLALLGLTMIIGFILTLVGFALLELTDLLGASMVGGLIVGLPVCGYVTNFVWRFANRGRS